MRARLEIERERSHSAHLAVHPDGIAAPRLEARVAQERAPHGDVPFVRKRAGVPDQLHARPLEHLYLLRGRAQSRAAEAHQVPAHDDAVERDRRRAHIGAVHVDVENPRGVRGAKSHRAQKTRTQRHASAGEDLHRVAPRPVHAPVHVHPVRTRRDRDVGRGGARGNRHAVDLHGGAGRIREEVQVSAGAERHRGLLDRRALRSENSGHDRAHEERERDDGERPASPECDPLVPGAPLREGGW